MAAVESFHPHYSTRALSDDRPSALEAARDAQYDRDRCAFPECYGSPADGGMCVGHQAVRIGSTWSGAGEDSGHRKGGEE